MPLRKSPESSVTEACIVEAAAQLFPRQGFKATTTREIAQLAEVNEATLFRYFQSKHDIFVAALKSKLLKVKMSRELQSRLRDNDDPSVTVEGLVRFLVENFAHQPQLVRLLQVAMLEVPESEAFIGEQFSPIFDAIADHYRRCAEKGRIGVEPSVATLGLFGVIAANEFLQQLLTNSPACKCEGEAKIKCFVQLWLRALAPAVSPTVSNCTLQAHKS